MTLCMDEMQISKHARLIMPQISDTGMENTPLCWKITVNVISFIMRLAWWQKVNTCKTTRNAHSKKKYGVSHVDGWTLSGKANYLKPYIVGKRTSMNPTSGGVREAGRGSPLDQLLLDFGLKYLQWSYISTKIAGESMVKCWLLRLWSKC